MRRDDYIEMLSYIDKDISNVPHNQNFKRTMLQKQNTSIERTKIFEVEMLESEKALHTKRIFLFIDYYLGRKLYR